MPWIFPTDPREIGQGKPRPTYVLRAHPKAQSMSCKSDVPFASCTANLEERILIPHVTLGDSSIKKQIVPPTSTSLAVSTWKIRKCFPNSKHGKEKKILFCKSLLVSDKK